MNPWLSPKYATSSLPYDTGADRSSRRAIPRLASWPVVAALVVAMVAVQTLGFAITAVSFVVLAGWALLGPRRAIEALSLVWILGLLNPDLQVAHARLGYAEFRMMLPLKWTVLLAAAGTCALHAWLRRQFPPAPVIWITVFCATVAAASVLTSQAPEVSIAKLTSFWLGASTVLLGFHLTRDDAARYSQWFLGIAAALVVINVPLLFSPEMYRVRDHLFRGFLVHPQYTALAFVPVLAWLLGRCLTEKRLGPVIPVLAAGAFLVTWPTGSRTAVFALGLSMLAAVVVSWSVRRPTAQQFREFLGSRRAAFAVLAILFAAVGLGERIGGGVEQFVQKRTLRSGAEPELWASREHFVKTQWHNFTQQPVFGSGFGIASGGDYVYVIRDPFTGLPVGAPTEKGFLPTAVLEETGFVGASLLLVALVSLGRRIARISSFPRLWMALAAFTVNLGESVFFSFGGIGLFLWMVIGLATIPDGESASGASASARS